MKFPDQALEVIRILNNQGHKAYIVGGSLREALLERPIEDIDMATSALPQEVMEIFSQEKIIPLGIKHGTLVLVYEGLPIEITTFRREGPYLDYRRPSRVDFSSSLEEDVKRRDFTVNALAYHPEEGLLDYVGGLEDLEKKILRSVGSASERFSEDALRMVRALRFLSSLGFNLEENTRLALFENRHLIRNISPQRIKAELDKLLLGEGVEEVLINYSQILSLVIPEIIPLIGFDQKTPYHCYDVWVHTAKVVGFSKKNPEHRLAALFHDIAKPHCFYMDSRDVGHFPGHGIESAKMAKPILARMGYSKKIIGKILPMIVHHNTNIYPELEIIARQLFFWGPETFFDVLDLKWADNLAKEPGFIRSRKAFEEVEDLARAYLADKPLLSYQDLALSAQELMELGYRKKALALAREKLIMAIFSGLANEKNQLIDYLEKNS